MACITICLALGAWQVKRLAWKNELIATLSSNSNYTPIAQFQRTPKELTKVSIVGQFLHEFETRIVPRTYEGRSGAHLLTPLLLPNGESVLVNRGWIPEGSNDIYRPNDVVKINGVVRLSGKTGFWTPDNDPIKQQWFYVDLEKMGLPGKTKPFYVQMSADAVVDTYPKPVDVPLTNNHLQYAITWFVLAFLLAMILLA